MKELQTILSLPPAQRDTFEKPSEESQKKKPVLSVLVVRDIFQSRVIIGIHGSVVGSCCVSSLEYYKKRPSPSSELSETAVPSSTGSSFPTLEYSARCRQYPQSFLSVGFQDENLCSSRGFSL